MKIYAIVNNLNTTTATDRNSLPYRSAGWYLLPDSSIVKSRKPVFVPDFAERFVALPSVIIKIGRLGKSIAPKFATRYIESVGMGANIVAPDLITSLKEDGLPATPALAFDRSLLMSDFTDFHPDMRPFSGMACIGDNTPFVWNENMMRLPVEDIISMVSRDNTLKTGDLIILSLPVPELGLPLHEGGRLFLSTPFIESSFPIK